MSDIKCVRLVAGEEVMGKVTMAPNGDVTIENAAAIHLIPRQDGQVGVGLHPWLPYSENESFEVRGNTIVTIHTPNVDMLNNYNRIFGSGIQIATAGSLSSM